MTVLLQQSDAEVNNASVESWQDANTRGREAGNKLVCEIIQQNNPSLLGFAVNNDLLTGSPGYRVGFLHAIARALL